MLRLHHIGTHMAPAGGRSMGEALQADEFFDKIIS
jgi:hypothetical protein